MKSPIESPEVFQLTTRRATGVRSRAGKARSSRNATKHGILSDVTVLKGESLTKFQNLLTELWETLEPEGRLEEILVEKLANVSWRHRRLLIAEGAEIQENAEFVKNVDLISQIGDPDVLKSCMELLRGLQNAIETRGFAKEADIAILRKIYGDRAYSPLDAYLLWADTAGTSAEVKCRQFVLIPITWEIERLKNHSKQGTLIDSEHAKLEKHQHSIFGSMGLDRLLRYETSLERGFDRALNQLERMQRLRRGQPVAPRIDVNVSS